MTRGKRDDLKHVLLIWVLCAAVLLLSGCAMLGQNKLDDVHLSSDGLTLTWGDRVYDAYGLITGDSSIGKQLGVADADGGEDSGSNIFELKGADPSQWLIERPRAMMSVHTVYRARGVTEVPEGVMSFQENADASGQ